MLRMWGTRSTNAAEESYQRQHGAATAGWLLLPPVLVSAGVQAISQGSHLPAGASMKRSQKRACVCGGLFASEEEAKIHEALQGRGHKAITVRELNARGYLRLMGLDPDTPENLHKWVERSKHENNKAGIS